MKVKESRSICVGAFAASAVVGMLTCGVVRAAPPIPIGSSTVTVGYDTTGGAVSFSGSRDFLSDATGPGDATVLGSAPNITAFNSVNSFGRRTALANSNPAFADVLGPNESLITHAFFKNVPSQLNDDFFPDLVPNGDLTFTVDDIHFDGPVTVDESTLLMHVLFNGDQVDQLPNFYFNVHNHHTGTDPFRNFDEFINGGIFSDFPFTGANYVLGDVTPQFTGNGTDTLGFSVTVPYDILKNIEEVGQQVPAGLPAPQGFLEPFHFHFEYVVTPEPATLALLLPGVLLISRRRRGL